MSVGRRMRRQAERKIAGIAWSALAVGGLLIVDAGVTLWHLVFG